MKSKSIRFLKLAALATLTGALFAPLFSGCRGVGYRHYPAPEQTDYSTNGTPVLTRQKGSALGVRILGLGVTRRWKKLSMSFITTPQEPAIAFAAKIMHSKT